jgi:hypothetical protein
VWVWLVASSGGNETLVVAGKIEAPPLLEAIVEKEMVFHGFVESGEDDHAE